MSTATFGETTVHQFIQNERDFVNAQAHVAACRSGRPGSRPPCWTRKLEDEAIERFAAGERHSTFNTRIVECAETFAREHGWVFHGVHADSPLYLYARDPARWSYSEPIFQLWLRPDGSFFMGHHRAGAWVDGGPMGVDTMKHFMHMCDLGEMILERDRAEVQVSHAPLVQPS